ncbi:MAG: prepilin-type N-terminal cleavage/methylation domain-containing protein [Verrucomicrobiales bacterium]|nr:prepilin-type N-terminal cleavage/methylation domain-containing protein [Verrucomicrobiales bacterium]
MNPETRTVSGFSLVEVMITVAVIGILAAIAIPNIGNVVEGSKRGVAQNVVETLNKATRQFGHSQWDLRSTPIPSSAGDEMLMLRTLQWRDPDNSGELNPKGPFMKNDWNPARSTSDDDYRAEWTGASWRLIEPGEAGAGLKIVFDGSDLGTIYTHSPGFEPVGSR